MSPSPSAARPGALAPTGAWLPPWPALRTGDLVDLVAPASSAPRAQVRAGAERLAAWGLRVRIREPLFQPSTFFAASDRLRWQHLRAALCAPDSAAVWCVRGGVGCLRLLPRLQALEVPPRAKPLIGFSDISVLLNVLDAAWGWMPVHGPVLTQLAPGRLAEVDLRRLRALLFGEQAEQVLGGLRALNAAARRVEVLRGRLLGGNLATLQSLAGGSGALRARGRVLFLEDVNERGYAVDRLLASLEQSGALAGVRAVLLGEFSGDAEPDGRRLARVALADLAARLRCPVFAGLPVGHGRRLAPLVLGAPARIEAAGARFRLCLQLRRQRGTT